MQIICPKCRTSYGVTATALGPQGRNVRCAKCKEVWLATPADAILAHALAPAQADAATDQSGPQHSAPGAGAADRDDWQSDKPPLVESPSIVNDPLHQAAAEQPGRLHDGAGDASGTITRQPRRGFARGAIASRARFRPSLSVAIAAMGALLIGLIIWRAEIVRMLPQTAPFFKFAGLKVNLRSLNFENVSVSSETVNGTPVLIIDGFVTASGAKPVEIPRLRLVVRDAQGSAIYSWNAVLDQAVLQPGERAAFKSRLASPPPNAHDMIVRFFNKRDIAAGGA